MGNGKETNSWWWMMSGWGSDACHRHEMAASETETSLKDTCVYSKRGERMLLPSATAYKQLIVFADYFLLAGGCLLERRWQEGEWILQPHHWLALGNWEQERRGGEPTTLPPNVLRASSARAQTCIWNTII